MECKIKRRVTVGPKQENLPYPLPSRDSGPYGGYNRNDINWLHRK